MSQSTTPITVTPVNPPAQPAQPLDNAPPGRPEDHANVSRADQLIRQQREAFERDQAAQAAAEAAAPAVPPFDPDASQPLAQPPIQQPAQPPASQPPAPQAPADGDSLDDLKRKLAQAQQNARTWEGRHAATELRLTQEMDVLRASLLEVQESTTSTQAEALFQTPTVTAEELEEYGPAMMDVIGRHAKAIAIPLVKAVEEKLRAEFAKKFDSLSRSNQQVVETQDEIRVREFYAGLDREVPGWRAQDVDAGFLAWLNSDDPVYGNRKIPFDKALQARDFTRVAAFFKGYAPDQGGTARPPAPTPTAPAPASAPAEEPTGLAEFAAPGRASASGPNPSGSGKRIWTMAEIRAHTRAIGRGEFKTADQKRRQEVIDREIAAAQLEGRVRQ